MAKEIVYTEHAPKPLTAYSQAVKAGGLIFVASQPPFDPRTGQVHGNSIQEQAAQCLRNVRAILHEGGSSLDKVVSATMIFDNENDFPGLTKNEANVNRRRAEMGLGPLEDYVKHWGIEYKTPTKNKKKVE